MRVMLIDDDASIRLLVQSVVEDAGYECCCFEAGEAALSCFAEERPDVVVLDVMMPKVDGFEACRRIRALDEEVPVLFLSAKGDIVDKKIGFSYGGDDYLVKPFDEEELLIRIEALLRRARRGGAREASTVERLVVGDFEFDTLRHEVLLRGASVTLTPKEFQLLFQLASHQGKVMAKDELIEIVWGQEYVDEAISIAVYVRRLREKIEEAPAKPKHLRTVWGVGYLFEA